MLSYSRHLCISIGKLKKTLTTDTQKALSYDVQNWRNYVWLRYVVFSRFTSLFIQSVLCYIFAIAVCATPYYYCLIQFAINVDCPSGWTIRLRLLRLYSITDCRYIDRTLWKREYERFKSVMLSVMKIFHSTFPQMFQFSMMVFKSKF